MSAVEFEYDFFLRCGEYDLCFNSREDTIYLRINHENPQREGEGMGVGEHFCQALEEFLAKYYKENF